jgi:hypothetical protein
LASKSPPPEINKDAASTDKVGAGRPQNNLGLSRVGVPKRIKRDDTKELFPSLAIESVE